MLRLSQGTLNLLSTCPRKFQHIFLEGLAAPIPPEQQAHIHWGDRFHLLLQQHQLQLPIAPMLAADPDLQRSFQALQQSAPELFTPLFSPDSEVLCQRESEHPRSLTLAGYGLTVVYDLLILGVDRAEIVDWKTYPRPLQAEQLAQDWQTRLYRYALVETSDYVPEQVWMTYWFVSGRGECEPSRLQFPYDMAQHRATKRDLETLLGQLDDWVGAYRQGVGLPQVAEERGICGGCPFVERCQRGGDRGRVERVGLLDLEGIVEVVIEG